MNNQFLENKNRVEALSHRILENTTDELFKERIRATFRRLERERMNLLVVGEFSRGKSTFVNAILEEAILPARVNPTTATINIIEGGPQRAMKIKYWDKEEEVLGLPDEKVNKYLDTFVTTKNKEANSIKKIQLSIPGKMQEWQCMLVDTPGVNDLDETREEVTYQYLSEADGCIILLDSQQIFSNSEQNFIKNKVMAKDINRLIFVINRIDEIDDDPNGAQAQRIKDHVKKLIKETIPEIKDPQIFAVSSKETLKARHYKEESVWRVGFDEFEEALVKFISKHASEGKLLGHVEQMVHILEEQITFITEQKEVLGQSKEAIREMITAVENEESKMHITLQSAQTMLKGRQQKLVNDIRRVYMNAFSELRQDVTQRIQLIQTEDEITQIKSSLTQGIRDIVEEIGGMLEVQREGLVHDINQVFNEDKAQLPAFMMGWGTPQLLPSKTRLRGPMLITSSSQYSSGGISAQEKAAMLLGGGGIAAYLAGSLFGPIGIVASIVGTLYFGEKLNEGFYERQRKEDEERKRKAVIAQMTYQFDEIVEMGKQNIEGIVSDEINDLEERIKLVVEEKREQLTAFITTKREEISKEQDEIKQIELDYQQQIEMYKTFLAQMKKLEEEIRDESVDRTV